MLRARSMVSLTDPRPSISSSSCLSGTRGSASSRLTKLSKEPPPVFAAAFLASALFKAMASLRLRVVDDVGSWAGSARFARFGGFVGVPDLGG